jgi:hypothetical protein
MLGDKYWRSQTATELLPMPRFPILLSVQEEAVQTLDQLISSRKAGARDRDAAPIDEIETIRLRSIRAQMALV